MPANRSVIIVDAQDKATMKLLGITDALQGLSSETVRFGKTAASAAPATAGMGQAANTAATATQNLQSRLAALTNAGMLSEQQAVRYQAAIALLNKELASGQLSQQGYARAVQEVGRAMEGSADKGRLFTRLGLTDPIQPASRLSGLLGGLTTRVIALGAAYVGVRGLRMAHNLALLGAQAEMTEQSFKRMTASVGLGAEVLEKMKRAAGGTIPELQLMQALNTSLIGTSAEFGREMANAYPQLIEIARAASIANPALGNMDFMLRSLAIGLKRMSPRLIDNLGLQLRLGEANKVLADKLGKTVKELTVEEQMLALLNDTLDKGAILVDQVGISNENAAVKSQVMGTAFSEFRVEVGKAIVELLTYQGTVTRVVQGATDVIRSGRETAEMFNRLSKSLKEQEAASVGAGDRFDKLNAKLMELRWMMEITSITSDEVSQKLYQIAVDAGFTEKEIAGLNLGFTELDDKLKLSSDGLSGMLTGLREAEEAEVRVADATTEFADKLEHLVDMTMLQEEQANLLEAEIGKLESRFFSTAISEAEFFEELKKITDMLPETDSLAVQAAAGILAMGSASFTAAGDVLSLADAMKILGGASMRALMTPAEVLEDQLKHNRGLWDNYYTDIRTRTMTFVETRNAIEYGGWEDLWNYVETGDKQAVEQRERAQKQAAERSASERQRQWQSLVGDISGLIAPTMPEDWWKKALPREDTWDEWARRAASVAAEGWGSEWLDDMQALDPDFQKLLEDIGDPKLAAATWIDQFYKGMHPEAINVQKIVNDYTDMMQREMARSSIAEQVAAMISQQAPGMQIKMPLIEAMVAGKPELGEIAILGQDVGEAAAGGVTGKLLQLKPVATMLDQFREDARNRDQDLYEIGEVIGERVADGVKAALREPDFLEAVATKVAPKVWDMINTEF